MKKEDYFLILTHTIDLLILSLKRKPSSYKKEEVDFLFKLFCFIVLDNNPQLVSLTGKIERIFEFLIEMYDSKNFEMNLNRELGILILSMEYEIEQFDLQKDTSKNEFIHYFNNLIHKVLYLINFFKSINSKRLKLLSNKLAFNSLFYLFENVSSRLFFGYEYYFFVS